MTRGALERLRSLLTQVDVVSPTRFVWYSEKVSLPPDLIVGLEPGEVRGVLRARLEQRIYERFYTSGGRHIVPLAPPPRPWLSELSAELTLANRGATREEPGWRLVARDLGRAVVERDGLRVWAEMNEVEEDPDGALRLRVPVDLPGISPGYHSARGEQPHDEALGPFVRLYWNLRPAGALPFMRLATGHLNAAGVPFTLKVLADPQAFGRADSGGLMLRRRDRAAALPVVRSIYAALADQLELATPAFTRRLAPGLGFAQDPGDGQSFGSSRCRLLADGLIAASERGLRSVDDQISAVRDRFAAAGISLDRPYLGPGAGPDDVWDLGLRPRAPLDRRPTETSFIETARALGRRLCEQAIWHRGRCTWLGPRPDERRGHERELVLADLDSSLYDGTAGVAVFLAELARLTGDEAARRTALGAVRQAMARRDDVPDEERGGLFGGWIGLALAAAQVGTTLGAPDLEEAAAELAAGLPDPAGHDVIDGAAGAILGLLALGSMIDDPGLLERARVLAAGLAQEVDVIARGELLGAAHGVVGVLRALDAAAEIIGDPELANAADAVRAELRRREPVSGISWCHGLSGVAPALRGSEAEWSLDGLRAELRGHVAERHPDLSLCHGLFGAADALIEIAVREPSHAEPLMILAREVGDVGVALAADGSWPCGITGEPPGLMLGLAGIGLGYLRLHDPQVRSPLAIPASWRSSPSQTPIPA